MEFLWNSDGEIVEDWESTLVRESMRNLNKKLASLAIG